MSLGRRKVSLHERERWVGNRVAEAYAARPAYPAALVQALAILAGAAPARIADVGAGTGNLALPLAARGHRVFAVEPAEAMLRVLQARATDAGLAIACQHGVAEALPLTAASMDLVIVADALHFLDAHRAGDEFARVLGARGALALVRSEPADTPFMRAVQAAMREAAPRRPRDPHGALAQVAARAGLQLTAAETFDSHSPLDAAALERILRSISFIGPAMNPERFAAFSARIMAIPTPRVWSQTITLHAGRRRTRTART